MISTLLSQTAATPSHLGMPARRSASVTGIACAAAVPGTDVRDRATGFARAPWDTPAWSPPTS